MVKEAWMKGSNRSVVKNPQWWIDTAIRTDILEYKHLQRLQRCMVSNGLRSSGLSRYPI